MGKPFVLFLVALLVGPAHLFAADQFNDAYYIEAPDFLDLSEKGSVNTPQEKEEPEAVVTYTAPADTSAQSAPQSSTTTSEVSTPDEAAEFLKSAGVVSSGGSTGANGYGVTVDGKKARSAFKKEKGVGDLLSRWKNAKNRRTAAGTDKMTTGDYYALIASELAGNDERLEQAAFAQSRFEITYRSQGALFWFIPITFPVRVGVLAGAENPDERVRVRLPWYRFFVNEYFRPAELASEIDVLIMRIILSEAADDEEELQAALFTEVALFLQQKVRTITDSVSIS